MRKLQKDSIDFCMQIYYYNYVARFATESITTHYVAT